MYVLRKDTAHNRLVVGTERERGGRYLSTSGVNWTSGEPPSSQFRASVKTRYTAAPANASVLPIDDGRRVRVEFDELQRDITPGQAAVFYEDEVVVGGGIIQ
jgi:tRNA-specific 2-thiouridylase